LPILLVRVRWTPVAGPLPNLSASRVLRNESRKLEARLGQAHYEQSMRQRLSFLSPHHDLRESSTTIGQHDAPIYQPKALFVLNLPQASKRYEDRTSEQARQLRESQRRPDCATAAIRLRIFVVARLSCSTERDIAEPCPNIQRGSWPLVQLVV
jgi:hypothetical protein